MLGKREKPREIEVVEIRDTTQQSQESDLKKRDSKLTDKSESFQEGQTTTENASPEPRRTSRRKIQSKNHFVTPEFFTRKKRQSSMTAQEKEEQKLMYQAIKNSLQEKSYSTKSFEEIPLMPVFHPTEEEFLSPQQYIQSLYDHEDVKQYGSIKIVPPPSYKPTMAFDTGDKKLPSRYQVLQKLAQGVPFKYNTEGHTLAEYKEMAAKLERGDEKIDWSDDKDVFRSLEKEYWDKVENQVGDDFCVQYAADLDASVFGNGLGTKDQAVIDSNQTQYIKHPWNLMNFQKCKNSLLQFPACQNMSGINVSWMYVGMKFSTFCWHFEDLMLQSINVSHYGKPKLWYSVPESNRERFDRAVKDKCALLFKKDPNILFDVTTMVSPAYLLSQGVRICKTLQRPGEFVVTYPGAYHGGFSTGLNIGEAVNFATSEWIDYGLKCQHIYRMSRERIPVFSIDWLVVENIRDLGKNNLDLQSLCKLRDTYLKTLADELKHRARMQEFIKPEQVKMLRDVDDEEEVDHQCKYCTDLCYLSMIRCSVHTCSPEQKQSDPCLEAQNFTNKYEKRAKALSNARESGQYCTSHFTYCGCPSENYTLVLRYTNEELLDMKSQILEACSARDSSLTIVEPPPKTDAITYSNEPKCVEVSLDNF